MELKIAIRGVFMLGLSGIKKLKKCSPAWNTTQLAIVKEIEKNWFQR